VICPRARRSGGLLKSSGRNTSVTERTTSLAFADHPGLCSSSSRARWNVRRLPRFTHKTCSVRRTGLPSFVGLVASAPRRSYCLMTIERSEPALLTRLRGFASRALVLRRARSPVLCGRGRCLTEAISRPWHFRRTRPDCASDSKIAGAHPLRGRAAPNQHRRRSTRSLARWGSRPDGMSTGGSQCLELRRPPANPPPRGGDHDGRRVTVVAGLRSVQPFQFARAALRESRDDRRTNGRSSIRRLRVPTRAVRFPYEESSQA
jgi:hypothetical protein